MYKTIENMELNNKTVVLRVDYNVPIKDNQILDDTRIVRSLKTINYLLEKNCKIVILSHLSKIKTEEDRIKNTLKPVSLRLQELLNKEVTFINDYRIAKNTIKEAANGSIIMLENTRWFDLPNKLESNCDDSLAMFLSQLGEVFVNDAFGTIHRKHASNFGISKYIPSCIGYLIMEEIKELDKLDNPEHKYVVILGGSKVSDKTTLVEKLVEKADYVLIGGGMSLTFLKSLGFNVGKSKVEEDKLEYCKDLLLKYKQKIVLPVDFICNNDFLDTKGELLYLGSMDDNDMCLDIGEKSIKNFNKYLTDARTILWNGPLGVYEFKNYQNGTKGILEYIKNVDAYKVVGGGDIVSAVNNLGYNSYINHISTGGGATLSYLQGGELPGLINMKIGD